MQQTILQTFTVVCRPWRSLMMVCNTLCCTEEHFSKVFQGENCKNIPRVKNNFLENSSVLGSKGPIYRCFSFCLQHQRALSPTVRMADSYHSAQEVVHMRGGKGHTSQYVKACFIFNKFYDATRLTVTTRHSLICKNIGEMFFPLASFLVYCRLQFHANASCFISVNFRRLDKSKVRKFKYSFSCSVVYGSVDIIILGEKFFQIRL